MSFDSAKSKNAVAKSKKNNQKKTFDCTHTRKQKEKLKRLFFFVCV